MDSKSGEALITKKKKPQEKNVINVELHKNLEKSGNNLFTHQSVEPCAWILVLIVTSPVLHGGQCHIPTPWAPQPTQIPKALAVSTHHRIME